MNSDFLFGVIRPTSDAKYVKSVGYDFLEGNVSEVLMPMASDEEYEAQFEKMKASPLPIRCCCCFIPGTFKLTGPKTDHVGALAYAKTALLRAEKLAIPYIVLGSGGARNFPDGFSKEEAVLQFTDFCKGLAEILKEINVTVVIEPLQKRESNLINTLTEGAEIVRAVGSEKIQLLADFYHMSCDGEDESSILKYGDIIRHCHIAQKADRLAPGTNDEDFTPFFEALKKVGYNGGVSCECGWNDFENDAKRTLFTLHNQSRLGN